MISREPLHILAANMGISMPGGHMAGSVPIATNCIPEALAQVEAAREVGKDADMIVAAANPLDDLRASRTVKHVIHRGRLVVKLRVKRKTAIDRELDKFL